MSTGLLIGGDGCRRYYSPPGHLELTLYLTGDIDGTVHCTGSIAGDAVFQMEATIGGNIHLWSVTSMGLSTDSQTSFPVLSTHYQVDRLLKSYHDGVPSAYS